MIWATLDTNVLLSSLVNNAGPILDLYNAWKKEKYRLIISHYILLELSRVMRLKLGYSAEAVLTFLDAFYQLAEIVEPILVADLAIDKDDLPILGTALAGRSEFLVTGDRQLLQLKNFAGIPIITPREFLEILR